jgi:hypothetical protein
MAKEKKNNESKLSATENLTGDNVAYKNFSTGSGGESFELLILKTENYIKNFENFLKTTGGPTGIQQTWDNLDKNKRKEIEEKIQKLIKERLEIIGDLKGSIGMMSFSEIYKHVASENKDTKIKAGLYLGATVMNIFKAMIGSGFLIGNTVAYSGNALKIGFEKIKLSLTKDKQK